MMRGVTIPLADIVLTGHFVFESGYHGDTWLELDRLVSEPRRLREVAERLAGQLQGFGVDLVCGPLEGGAFVGQLVAAALDVRFTYARRGAPAEGMAPPYLLPDAVDVSGARAIVVDDAINLGSAALSTAAALAARGCQVVAIASPIVCLPAGPAVGERLGVPQVWLVELPTTIWAPKDCPHCA